ncbi:uncharacterized protein LOC117113663 [Anneissia japonica]|uniref:uncharacterized protein LOC117113663 n=1 Tax=Anneissia japonica TaxID=1529436 RepID=UPI001425AE19|nr:uncharacterized protein LOC117113663 [Anneissia japonica]
MATPVDIDKLTEAGKELGYVGKPLQDYVRELRESILERQEKERLERAAERELKIEAAVQMERLEQVKVEKEKQEIEKLKLKMELLKAEREGGFNSSGESGAFANVGDNVPQLKCSMKNLKIPTFDEVKDKMDVYLMRYERYAIAMNWPREYWAIQLAPLLSGRALLVYTTIEIEFAHNYEILKRELLRVYRLTEAGYREKFKFSAPEEFESAAQYLSRIGSYLDRWICCAGVKQTYNDLREFVIKDQFLSKVPESLAVHLREKVDCDDFAKVADVYIDAHGGWGKLDNLTSKINAQQRKETNPKFKRQSCQQNRGSYKGNNYSNLKIHNNTHNGRDKSNIGRSPSNRKCHYCHEEGHFWRQCSKAPKDFAPMLAMVVEVMREERAPDMMPIQSTVCDKLDRNLPVYDGFIGNKQVRLLRDTWCNGIVVKS